MSQIMTAADAFLDTLATNAGALGVGVIGVAVVIGLTALAIKFVKKH